MTELSGLELRRAVWEARGWRHIPAHLDNGLWVEGFWQKPDGSFEDEDTGLPPIESDPAVSEPMFLEWCEKNGYEFNIGKYHGRFICRLWKCGAAIEVSGSTPSDVRIS